MSERLDRIVEFYEHLTRDRIADVRVLYSDDALFKDPFNDVVGHTEIERIFHHMFDQLEHPVFRVSKQLEEGADALLEWSFSFSLSGRAINVSGASMLRFAEDGRVQTHRDYWDPAEELYSKLPGIGIVFRWLQRRMSAAAR